MEVWITASLVLATLYAVYAVACAWVYLRNHRAWNVKLPSAAEEE